MDADPPPPPRKLRKLFLRIWQPVADASDRLVMHDGLEIAGSMAFSAILALFPFLIFLFAAAAFFDMEGTARDVAEYMFGTLPPEVANALSAPLMEAMRIRDPDLLTIGAVLALWAASNGVETLRTGLTRAYDAEEERSVIRRRIESIFIVILSAGLALVVGYLTVVSNLLWPETSSILPQAAVDFANALFGNAVFHYAIAFVILFLALLLSHLWLPGGHRSIAQVLPGVLLTCVAWLVLAAGFSAYLSQFGSYVTLYGGLGGVAAAMVFFYFTATVILFGAELNRALKSFAAKASKG